MRKRNAVTIAMTVLMLMALFLAACNMGVTVDPGPPPVAQTAGQAEDAATAEPATPEPTLEALSETSVTDGAWPTPIPWPERVVAAGTLAVDASVGLGPISPYVYGSNYGPWVFVPIELQDAAAASGVTMLRFPGGEWGDRNDLQEIQIDRFLALAEQMNAEPAISVRLRGGTPEQAAELVRYVNIEQGLDLPYWSIGNEPNLYPDYDAERFVTEWRAMAEAMRAVDPDIKLLGPEVSQFTGGSDPGPSEAHIFLDRFLETNGDLVDIVTVHRYPLGTRDNRAYSIAEVGATTAEWDELIPDLRERVRRLTGRDLPVGVTEINTHWTKDQKREDTPDSHYNAIWLSDVLGRMIRQRVAVVNHFVLASRDNQGPWGLLANDSVRPSYYVYQLYQRFGQELLYADSGQENVSVYAARRDDGALTILAINLGETAVALPLSLSGHAGGTAEYYRLDPERVATGTVGEAAGTAEIADGAAVELPPQSVTLYVLP